MTWRNKLMLNSRAAGKTDAAEGGCSTGIENTNSERLSTPGVDRQHRRARILVVDDDADVRQHHYDVLIQSGYRVDAVTDDESGWDMLGAAGHGSDNYRLLITNNLAPNLPGHDRFKRLPVIRKTLLIIPASAVASIQSERLRLHAILPSPVATSDLLRGVQLALRVDGGRGQFQRTTDALDNLDTEFMSRFTFVDLIACVYDGFVKPRAVRIVRRITMRTRR